MTNMRCGATTLNSGPRMTKLAPDFNFPKILTVIEDFLAGARIDGETAASPKIKWPKNRIFGQKSIFGASNPHFFHFPPYSFAKTDISFYLLHFALQCREHGAQQYVPLPKIGPIRRISMFQSCEYD